MIISTKFTSQTASNSSDNAKYIPYLIPSVKRGKIKAIDVSNYSLDEIKIVNKILSKEVKGFYYSKLFHLVKPQFFGYWYY